MKTPVIYLVVVLAVLSCSQNSVKVDPPTASYHPAPAMVAGSSRPATVTGINTGYAKNGTPVTQTRTAGERINGGHTQTRTWRATNFFISGRCSVKRTGNGIFDIPCKNVSVILRDSKGRFMRETITKKGKFDFDVENRRTYTVEIKSKKYRLKGPKAIKAEAGDDLLLSLVPKK